MLLGALPGNTVTIDAKTVAASNASALKPSSLSFVASRWYCTQGGSYFNAKNCHLGAMVPKGWKATNVSARDAKFAVGTDFLRIAEGPARLTTAKAVANKKASLKGTRDLRVLGGPVKDKAALTNVLARATTSAYQAG